MLKKTAITAFVLMIVFSIVFAALIPLATADMIMMADSRNEEFAAENELLSCSAEGIKSVKLNGDRISDLEVTTSPDKNIHLITNGYRIREITSQTQNVDENGILVIEIKMNQSSRVNRRVSAVFRAVMAEIYGNSCNYIRLELPAGIEFISGGRGSYNYGNLDIADDVAVSERACPICGEIDCDKPECKAELEEIQLELEQELYEYRAERREELREEQEELHEELEERRAEMEEYLAEKRAGGGY